MYFRKFNSFQHCHNQRCASTQLNAIFTEKKAWYSGHVPRCKICHNTTSLLDVTAHSTLLEDQLCSKPSRYWPCWLCSSFVKECLTPSVTALIVSSSSLPTLPLFPSFTHSRCSQCILTHILYHLLLNPLLTTPPTPPSSTPPSSTPPSSTPPTPTPPSPTPPTPTPPSPTLPRWVHVLWIQNVR